MLSYDFFDYKGLIDGYNGEDYYGTAHLIFMVLATIAIIVICILCRNIKREKFDIYLKVLSIVVPILEVIKIVWESYWDIKTGVGFNWIGILPLYTCSMFIYTVIIAAWGKGKIKEYAISWMATIGVFGGLTNFYITNILTLYPFFTFATFLSLQFHFLMVVTGLLIVISKYQKIEFIDGFKGFIPLAIFSVIVIPIDYAIKADYMLYYYGLGAPVLSDLAETLGDLGLRWVYTILMIFGYLGISYLFVSIYKGIEKINKIVKSKV